jgi:hypothetical protein
MECSTVALLKRGETWGCQLETGELAHWSALNTGLRVNSLAFLQRRGELDRCVDVFFEMTSHGGRTGNDQVFNSLTATSIPTNDCRHLQGEITDRVANPEPSVAPLA